MRSLVFLLLSSFVPACLAQSAGLSSNVERELASLVSLYKDLHAAPELSHQEEKTSALLAGELKRLGFEVTERVGKYPDPAMPAYGVVAVMKNGAGPTVLVRADMDALPIEEQTGLPYASKVRAKDAKGRDVPVMFACGHDIHVTTLIGTARMLAQLKNQWHGTLVLVGQPAEEVVDGARAMLADGMYERFPKPSFALALHDSADIEAGKVGVISGFALANATSVDVTFRGVGGHGAWPQKTKDPVVMAAEYVMAIQTIVSREIAPIDPAVVTVGSIHGGTKHNIIPDEVQLQLTVRSYKEEVRKRILASLERIAKGIALAGGVPEDRMPTVKASETEFTPATYNDPALTTRVTAALKSALGAGNVLTVDPVMGGEDFGYFSMNGRIPAMIFWLGAVDPKLVAANKAGGPALPSLHSSKFAPLPEPTLRTGVTAMTSAVLDLMKK